MNTETKSKRKFNFVDAIVIALVATVIALLAFIFIFYSDFVESRKEKVTICYAVEISRLRDEMVGNVQKGDTVSNSVKHEKIGTVVETLVGDSEEIGVNKDGQAIAAAYPDHNSLIVIVKAEASRSAFEYTVDGYDFEVGSTMYLRMPNLSSVGYCISMTEVESEEDIAAFIEACKAKVFIAPETNPESGSDESDSPAEETGKDPEGTVSTDENGTDGE